METTFKLEHNEVLTLLLFTDVNNVQEIIEKVTHNSPPFSDCIIINSQLIVDPFQVLVAANKAVVAKHSNSLITKSVCTELLFNLSPSENITASLNKFGYHSSNSNVLLAVFSSDPSKLGSIKSEIEGIPQALQYVSQINDINLIKSTYDVAEEHLVASSLLSLVVTKIACKGI